MEDFYLDLTLAKSKEITSKYEGFASVELRRPFLFTSIILLWRYSYGQER
jgi:hypothetical protein